MVERAKLNDLNDFFSVRAHECVYFCRINGYNDKIAEFISRYYAEAKRCGAVIEGGIPNPDQKNLAYYNEMMGQDFAKDTKFISRALVKWMPRLSPAQNYACTQALYNSLCSLEAEGKNENILKNAYIKFMCWLYYRFEGVVNKVCTGVIPKILYEGYITRYELVLISALCGCGCDVVLLQYRGDAGYRKTDPAGKYSDEIALIGANPFPEGFSVAKLREQEKERAQIQRLYGGQPEKLRCTNAWAGTKYFDNIKVSPLLRGQDFRLFYNCFYLIKGADDRVSYPSDLYTLRSDILKAGRGLIIANGRIEPPGNEQIQSIKRSNYQSFEQLAQGLSANINFVSDNGLRSCIVKAFIDTLSEEHKNEPNLGKLTTKAVYLLCWLRTYYPTIYKEHRNKGFGVFIFFGNSFTANEGLFLKFLAACPMDVLILCPDAGSEASLEDKFLLATKNSDTVALREYPTDESVMKVGTVAYHAERDLDTMLYTDSGLYRDQQYSKASSVILQTMYEEIAILWDQELKYRPGFSTDESKVTIPVIFAKINGVKDGDMTEYWRCVKELLTPEAFLITRAPFFADSSESPAKPYAVDLLKNRKLLKKAVKEHKCYRYGFMREEAQDHILDKIQLLLDSGMIKDQWEFGREYVTVAVLLNLSRDILRIIQSFDFTKKNPKIVYIITNEAEISLEDTIILSFLSLVGFDVVFFVPTGYRCIEKYFASEPYSEHQIGEYKYDQHVPDFKNISAKKQQGFFGKLFGKR